MAIAVEDWQRAARLFAQARFADARIAIEAMLAQDPDSAEAWLALTQVDIHSGEVRLAAQHALSAAALRPVNPKTSVDIAAALLTVGEVAAARASLEQAASLAPREAALRQQLALQYQNLGDHDAALTWMERARESGLVDPASRFTLANQFTFHGRLAAAEAELEQCALLRPPFGRAMAQLSQLRRQTPEHNHLDLLGRQLAEVQVGCVDHAALEFARYKELEDLARYEEAWQSLQRANQLMHALVQHDADAEQRTIAKLRAQTTRSVTASSRQQSGPQPIFVVGLPRSGTTLLDRLLGNHVDVYPAGELGTFRRCLERVANRFTGPMLDEAFVQRLASVDLAEVGALYLANTQWRAQGRRFFVDKLPRNWLLVPMIHEAIPGAKILHMTREPIAVAFSNYRSYFGSDYPYCYDEDALAKHYLGYRRTMHDWHALRPGAILDVPYRSLVAEPGVALRRVFEFCGLDWQPDCVDLTRNQRPVATLSAVQVRGAIETGMGGRWRHYESHLARLRQRIAVADQEIPVFHGAKGG
ncbi:MAG TPA: sulfotransferase [Rhodanobacteraceae bacterium]